MRLRTSLIIGVILSLYVGKIVGQEYLDHASIQVNKRGCIESGNEVIGHIVFLKDIEIETELTVEANRNYDLFIWADLSMVNDIFTDSAGLTIASKSKTIESKTFHIPVKPEGEESDPAAYVYSFTSGNQSDFLSVSFNNEGVQYQVYYMLEEVTATRQKDIQHLVFYPNPATNELVVNDKESLESLEIYTIRGELVMRLLNPGFLIDISGLSGGSFMVVCKTVDGTYHSVKLIKQDSK